MRAGTVVVGAALAVGLVGQAWAAQGQSTKPRPPAPSTPTPFVTPYSPEEMRDKQVVFTTTLGDIVIDLLPDRAPNHVGLFMKTARDGGFTGTTFHRVVRQGIVQGGDPYTKDPATRAKAGTGGLNLVAREDVSEPHTRGAVSTVIVPGRPDSGGTQFFICIVDQPGLNGLHTVFGRVSEGLRVAQRISEGAADEKGTPAEPVAITAVTVRDRPAEVPPPFATEPVEALAKTTAVIETSAGDITIGFTPDQAPAHVRNFLRLASLGAYDGTTFHRVVKGFVIQGGMMTTRREPLSEAQERHVTQLTAEFNDQPHDLGVVSMARQAEPDTASTSFFIVTARASSLDQKYTVFGKVLQGLDVVQAIEAVPVNGEAPVEPVVIRRVRVVTP